MRKTIKVVAVAMALGLAAGTIGSMQRREGRGKRSLLRGRGPAAAGSAANGVARIPERAVADVPAPSSGRGVERSVPATARLRSTAEVAAERLGDDAPPPEPSSASAEARDLRLHALQEYDAVEQRYGRGPTGHEFAENSRRPDAWPYSLDGEGVARYVECSAALEDEGADFWTVDPVGGRGEAVVARADTLCGISRGEWAALQELQWEVLGPRVRLFSDLFRTTTDRLGATGTSVADRVEIWLISSELGFAAWNRLSRLTRPDEVIDEGPVRRRFGDEAVDAILKAEYALVILEERRFERWMATNFPAGMRGPFAATSP